MTYFLLSMRICINSQLVRISDIMHKARDIIAMKHEYSTYSNNNRSKMIYII